MTTTREITELAGPSLKDTVGKDSIIVLPVGSIEHHGPHLPLATDFLIADELSRRVVDAAAAKGLDVWRLPTIPYTKSDEHDWAPGTVWIGADELLATLRAIGQSVAKMGVERLVFFNGHGGNVALLQVALREVRRLTGLKTFSVNVSVPAGNGIEGPDERGFPIHGGWGETSLLAHLRPDLVDESLYTRAIPDHLTEFQHIGFAGKPVQFGWLSDDFGFEGVVGDPTGSSVEAGAKIAAANVEFGVSVLEEVARFDARGPISEVTE